MSDPPIVRHAVHSMATRFELVLWGLAPSMLAAIAQEAAQEIMDLGIQLSAYDPAGDIWEINSNAGRSPTRVEPRLCRLLERCIELSDQTAGAFDIAIRPLLDLWGVTTNRLSQPSPKEIEATLSRCGSRRIELDHQASSVAIGMGCCLDLGAVGKGYALDRAADVIRSYDVPGALLHGGTSTTQAIGSSPDGTPWRVAIASPSEAGEAVTITHMVNRSLSVSAPHGKWLGDSASGYGHVLDPLSGYPCRGSALAAVCSPSATESDALSTALLVMGLAGLPVITTRPACQALVLDYGLKVHGAID